MALIGSMWGAGALAASPVNPFVARLQAMSEVQRRGVMRGAVVNAEQRCGRVELAEYRGPYRNLFMWAVRCVPGGDYGMFVGPDGSAQVRSCGDIAKLSLPLCRLPAAAGKR